jgi:two-component system sensor histidine kinase KdpD
MRFSRSLRHSAEYTLAGGVATGLCTWLCVYGQASVTLAASIYLLLVVFQSLTGDFLSAGVVSVLATACLDYFFVPPLFSFRIVQLSDAFALLAFLITSVVITQLVSRLRAEVDVSKRQRDRLARLYQLSQVLLRLEPEATSEQLMEPFRHLFGIRAISIFDGQAGEARVVGGPGQLLAEKTKEAYIFGRDAYDKVLGIGIRRLERAGKIIGAIGFEGLSDPEETIAPLATLTNAYLDRMQAFQTASAASAATQAEVLRSAILDAMAHEIKTPLATILAAAGGIQELGPLQPEQKEMAELVETEAERLGQLASRLLRVARLNQEEIRPRLEEHRVATLVHHLAERYRRQWPYRRITNTSRGENREHRVDPELLRLALSQLMDNACKYSKEGSAIDLTLELEPEHFVIAVANTGSSIPVAEQRLIFDRFYRGSEAKGYTAGSGVGLYVARKIATAHGGTLQLVASEAEAARVVFRLKIPSPQSDNATGYAATTP